MFGPDLVCLALVISLLSAVPVVLAWPEKRYDYPQTKRETVHKANFHTLETRKE